MSIFDYNRDIKLALTATIFDEQIFTDMAMVKISDCFHYIITSICYVMKLAGMICKLDRFLEICRLCSAICKLARLADWTEHIYCTKNGLSRAPRIFI